MRFGLHLESGHDRQARQVAGRSRPPREQLIDYLRHKRMLLVLDNYEHLLDPTIGEGGEDAAGLASTLLQNAPNVVIVATSRERLQLQEEQVLLLQGMAAPQSPTDRDFDGYAAVQLFVQRARQVQPAFALSPTDPERLAIDGDLVKLLAQLLCALAYASPNIEEGQPLLQESLLLLQSPILANRDVRDVEALAYYLLGEALHSFGYALAVTPYEEALTRYRALNDAWGLTLTLNSLGWLTWMHYGRWLTTC
jgi:hypothetical protein